MPENAVAFRFFNTDEHKEYSGWYYVGGTEMTLAEVKTAKPTEEMLIENMETNGWDRVVFTDEGKVFPLHEKDSVLKRPVNIRTNLYHLHIQ
jgi:hypothetical protein